MRKFLVYAIPIATIILFLAVMLSGNYLKQPLGKDDNIPELIDALINDIQNEQWEDAGKKTEELTLVWKKIVFRVQFSAERNEINNFSVAMARLQGAILEKDRLTAIIELKEAYEHWDQLCK
ncbi:MAG: DUF4363 family protein [Acetivibrionales bacterium]|mgnify:CR=1 FL=1|jgi:hypothetical protein|nr:DUF4363 family protein [Clostridiaceae bacterium]